MIFGEFTRSDTGMLNVKHKSLSSHLSESVLGGDAGYGKSTLNIIYLIIYRNFCM